MGDDDFRRMSTMVFASLYGKSMNAFQFRDFLNRNSTVDMSSYFDDYIFNPGYNTFYMDSFVIENINNENYLNIGIAQKSYHAAHLYRDVPIIVSTYDKNLKRMEFNTTLGGPNSKVKFKLPADYIPTVVLLNVNQKLNLATLQSQTIVKKTGPANVPYTAMTVNVSNFSDSSFVNIAHHLVGPDTDRKGTNIDRISSNHFWQVSIIQHGNLEIDGRIEYNGNDSASIDSDILFTSEDSLRLVYRQKPSDPWEDYPYYNKLMVNPTDRKGFVRITKLLPGDYALAHGYKVNVASHQTNHLNWNVFPNPASNLIKLSADVNFENHYYEVIDVHGKKVMSGQCSKEIVIESIPSGNYELAIYDQNRASIFQYAFIKL